MAADDDVGALLPAIAEAQARFVELVREVRPELFRYCARMTGSVFDGEDVVQETLAKACYALGRVSEPPPLCPWLFRIAHNTAMDHLRRYERKNVDLVPEPPETAETAEREIDPELVEAALSVFAALPPVQRSALVLKDVLGHTLEETAATMGTTVSAVKAALVRARVNVRIQEHVPRDQPAHPTTKEHRAKLARYADLFNARDWDGLRALVGEESRLDLVSRAERRGAAVAEYYSRYQEAAESEALRAMPGWVDGVATIAVFRGASSKPAYFVLLEWDGPKVTLIRDFRYVPYIADGARFDATV
jgi:RNA polymerase sigma-70 factor (ECF subfamily)